MTDGLETEILRGGLEVLTQLEPEWRALCEESPYDQPFYRPELIRTYVQTFAVQSALVILTLRLRRRLVAVLPLVREIACVAGIPARKLRSPGNVHTCRFDLVHEPGLRDLVIAALWHALKKDLGWDVLELSSVPIGGALASLVHLAASEGFPTHAIRAATSPYVALPSDGDPFERILGRVDAKFRSNLRRRMRKLQAKGPVRLVHNDAAGERLLRFYELERSGWKGDARTAIDQDAYTLRYYQALAREAEHFGYLSVYSLECGEETVAMQYGLMHRGRYFVLKTAYDQALGHCSPGQLLTLEILRDITKRQCVELDFLGLPMEWKRDWAPRLRPHADWYVFRGGVGAVLHLIHARARRTTGRTLRKWKRMLRHNETARQGTAR